MKNLLIAYILIVLFGLSKVKSDDTDVFDDDKIVGGEDARIRYKYQASLRIGTSHTCGGVIIHESWILTAAHCPDSINRAYIGSNFLVGGAARVHTISRKIKHQGYNGEINDIALFRTTITMQFDSFVGKIDLPSGDVRVGEILMATGWGKTSTNGPLSPILKQLEVKVLSQADCSLRMKRTINSLILCTFKSEGNGLCQGDSGGPLVRNGRVYGIVSAVIPCARGFPDLQTRVIPYLSWIRNMMR